MLSSTLLVIVVALLPSTLAAPTVVEELENAASKNPWTSALNSLSDVVPTANPTATAQASRSIASIFGTSPTPSNYLESSAELIKAGLTTNNFQDALNMVTGSLIGPGSENNVNPVNPKSAVYPKLQKKDAPYSLTEAELRKVIYIPSTFKYGKGAQPVMLVPGTGNTGDITFGGNYITLLQGQNAGLGDPVWLNIPNFLLGDAQVSAEYVAYAINYIHGISNNHKVAVFGWSQGNINTQWAFKYWPSTRGKVTDHVAFAPDYHGTILANLIGEVPLFGLPPSVWQQDYNSDFIKTLRANNGDSAYVPTTTIYSGLFDEIVEPQQGTGASAYLLDKRNVGVTNNEVQLVCKDQVAGSIYTHEGILYNPLGHALAMDALKHDGPGRMSRLDLPTVCSTYLTPGLDLESFLLTENAIAVAGAALVVYPNKPLSEPPIKGYAK